jgi:hypothetical protein
MSDQGVQIGKRGLALVVAIGLGLMAVATFVCLLTRQLVWLAYVGGIVQVLGGALLLLYAYGFIREKVETAGQGAELSADNRSAWKLLGFMFVVLGISGFLLLL